MKQKLYILIIFLLSCNFIHATYFIQASTVSPLTGGQSYTINSTPNLLRFSVGFCAYGSSQPQIATTYTLSWYVNTIDSNVGGTLISSSTQNTLSQVNIGEEKSLLPDTNVAGTYYYYAVLSNPSSTGCGFTTTLKTTTQQVIIIAPATHLNFDGVNDYVNCGTNPIFDFTTGTIEVMINVKESSTNRAIISKRNSGSNTRWSFHVNENNNTFGLWTGSLYSTINVGVIDPNTWYHVTFVIGSTDTAVYVDGIYKGIINSTINTSKTGTSLIIGSTDSVNEKLDEYFVGNIDDVRIWNTTRTATEINANKNCELQGTETGLIAYYKFNQGAGSSTNTGVTTLTDATANANNGTLNGFGLTGSTSNWLAGSPVTTGSIIPSVAKVATPVVYNQNETASTLSATTGANGTGLVWYTASTGGSGSSTAPTPTTATAGSTSYWVSSKNANGCESARTEIVVTVKAQVPATHLNFDGVNDYISLKTVNLPVGSSPRTLEAMMKSSSQSGSQSIVNYGNQSIGNSRFGFLIVSGKLYFVGEGNDYNTNVTIGDSKWHHIAATYESSILKIYVDGALVATQTKSLNTNNNMYNIGASVNSTPREFFPGDIDEVRIWNTARTAEQINASKNCELQGNEVGLVSYYKFNQGNDAQNNSSITTLNDAAANANNGTVTNFTLTGATSNWAAGSPVVTGVSCSTLSTKSYSKSNSIKVYPNPTSNFVTIEASTMENASVQISDVSGRILVSKNISETTNTIDLSPLQNGVYIFKIKTQDGESVTKVIKQ